MIRRPPRSTRPFSSAASDVYKRQGLHSPGVRKHCQIIFACYFRKSSIIKRGAQMSRGSIPRLAPVRSRNVAELYALATTSSHSEHRFPAPSSKLCQILNWANVCSPNILRTLRRTMIRFLIELLVRRTWFGQSKLYFRSRLACNEMQASARTCGRRAADSMIETVG